MKQVCPLYRVQFIKWHNSCDRQTDRQTDRQGLFRSLLFCAFCFEYVKQARPARYYYGRDAPVCVFINGGDME